MVAKSPVIPFRVYKFYVNKTNGLTLEGGIINFVFFKSKANKNLIVTIDEFHCHEGVNPSYHNIKIKPYLR
jgi:hypothetical protein